MKAIRILNYFFSCALFIMVLCIMLNFKLKYFGTILGFVLVASSILFFLNDYQSRKNKS
jgi:hypothetical protein